MAALKLPILPIPSQTGAPDLPILPAPPMGGGRNGKWERESMTVDQFGLEQVPQRIRAACSMALMARDCRDVRREIQALDGKA